MKVLSCAGLVLTILVTSAQASSPDIDGVYRCVLETDDSNFRKVKQGTEFVVASWLGTMTVVWPFGGADTADDCEEIDTQSTCKNDEAHVIIAYDSASKKFHLIRKAIDIRGAEVERRTISGSCQPLGLRYSLD